MHTRKNTQFCAKFGCTLRQICTTAHLRTPPFSRSLIVRIRGQRFTCSFAKTNWEDKFFRKPMWPQVSTRGLGKTWPPYRLETLKIFQKYNQKTRKYNFRNFWVYFCPTLLVGVFSSSVWGQVLRNSWLGPICHDL